ncbi:YbaB/EbfC family nucleoid-associated protein [Gammaproteobacteria bacterium LSUCC0057]|jgi:DNA-binding YbaB/EbfC family protein|uniref:Nucleoid-associated protein E3W66_03905 n=1 Tax=Gammaproteobacteria bacterium LSUCC0057 TaxID=2559237 RepID=A0A4Y8UKU9_9GAMM|nr:YbaB/EbfC family nucleoid-associated protein [Gammaproteobacteria bacterium LSUCC0057]
MDINELMKKAQQMQSDMAAAQQRAAQAEVTGEAGAGLVKVTMTGRHDVKKVTIDPALLQEEVELLEDLLAAAVNDAVRRVEKLQQSQLGELAAGVQMPPGFKFPFGG